MAGSIARELEKAILEGRPIPPKLEGFVRNDNPHEVRLITVRPEKVRVYSSEAVDHKDWDPHAHVAVAPDAPVQIGRSPLHPGDTTVKLFFDNEAQLYTAELGRTFVFDGSTLITVFPRELPK